MQETVRSMLANGFHVDFQNGWIYHSDLKNTEGSLLFWVPPHHRQRVCSLRTLTIMGTQQTALDFSKFVHGYSWVQCHPHPRKHFLDVVHATTEQSTEPSSTTKDVSVIVHSMTANTMPVHVLRTNGQSNIQDIIGFIIMCSIAVCLALYIQY